jgi:hypothetical protein
VNFIHTREFLSAGDVAVLECDTQCNFRLTDDLNFAAFERGDAHTYYGGFFTHFPARIPVPSTGYWNVTIDLGGGSANIRYSLSYIKRG